MPFASLSVRLALTILGAAITVPASAQIASSDPAAVQAGTYAVDARHTQVTFTLSHFGFTDYSGALGGATGSLSLDSQRPSSSKLTVSVPVGSLVSTVPALDAELKGPQFLDAAKFSDAQFAADRITVTGKGRATIVGKLTLHGVSQPLTLDARFIGAGINPINKAYTVGFEGTGTIKRSAFGIMQYLPLVGDDVQLTIHAAFERQP